MAAFLAERLRFRIGRAAPAAGAVVGFGVVIGRMAPVAGAILGFGAVVGRATPARFSP
jgi:hypothetical protein